MYASAKICYESSEMRLYCTPPLLSRSADRAGGAPGLWRRTQCRQVLVSMLIFPKLLLSADISNPSSTPWFTELDERELDEAGARELLRRLNEANADVEARIARARAVQQQRAALQHRVGQELRQRQLEARKLHQVLRTTPNPPPASRTITLPPSPLLINDRWHGYGEALSCWGTA